MKFGLIIALAFVAISASLAPSVSAIYLKADFSYVADGRTVSFEDASAGVEIVAWFWTFGEKNTSHEQNPIHTFPGYSTYVVNLTVTNVYGELSTKSRVLDLKQSQTPPYLSSEFLIVLVVIVAGLVVVGLTKDPYVRIGGVVAILLAVVIYAVS